MPTRSHLGSFEWIGAARVLPGNVTFAENSAIMSVAAVTPGLAAFLDMSPTAGVVISRRIWNSDFNAGADVTGKQIRIDGVNVRVGGVAPDWLEGFIWIVPWMCGCH